MTSGSTKHETLGNLLGGLFAAFLITVLCVVGIAPNQANGALRAVAGGSGGGGVPSATCANNGGIIYATGGAFTCNISLTTDGAGAASASASVTSPVFNVSSLVGVLGRANSGDGIVFTNNNINSYTFRQGNANIATVDQNIGLKINNGEFVCWSSSADSTGTCDTVMSRGTVAGQLVLSNSTGGGPTGSIAGVNTNSSAPAGSIGEFINSSVASSGAIVMNSGTPITTVSTGATVTAGDYDAQGTACYSTAIATSITVLEQGISTSNNTFSTLGSYTSDQFAAMVPLATGTNEICRSTPTVRVSLSGTSTVFLVTRGVFTVSTLSSYGFLRLRRVR